MSLSRAISNAYSGLATTSRRADIAAGNIANANTPGYVRRVAVLTERSVGNIGNGVNIDSIERLQNFAISRERRDADAALARSDVIATAFGSLNEILGEPDDAYGIFASLSRFEGQLTELAASPDSAALLGGVLSAAYDTINQFHTLSEAVRSMRSEADASIARDVTSVNSNLERLAQLNNEIAKVRAQSEDYSVLEDERQRIIDSVNEIIPIRVNMNEHGWAEIMTVTGVPLLTSRVHEISFAPAGVVPPEADYRAGIGNLSGLYVGDQEITPGSDSIYALSSGRVAGYFAVRDDVGVSFNQQLDSLAYELIDRFSAAGIDPTLLAGQPGLFTDRGAAADPANLAGLAQRIALNAAVDPNQGGKASRLRDGINAAAEGNTGNSEILNNLVAAMADSRAAAAGGSFSGQFNMTEITAEFMTDVGSNRLRYDSIAMTAYARADILYQAEVSASGVDTDEEMQSLLLIEQAYAANARVIETVNTMIDYLMRI